MVRECFDEIWDTISDLQGQEFRTEKGEKFQYFIENNQSGVSLKAKTGSHYIDEGNFFKAYLYMSQYPVADSEDIDNVASHKGESRVEGSSYVWAILNDKRILDSCN